MQLPEAVINTLARGASRQTRVPAALIAAIIQRESGGDPTVVGDQGKALGLMQLHPAATADAGVPRSALMDPETNAKAGARYLAHMLSRFADPRQAIGAYNAGPGAAKQAGGVPPSAQPYVNTVAGTVKRLTAPGAPFADEVQSLPDSAAQDMSLGTILDDDRAIRLLKQLMGQGGQGGQNGQ